MFIEDEAVSTKYNELPEIIYSWVKDQITLDSANILDFGCGEGLTALGFASRFQSASVAGVDIMPDPNDCLDRARTHLGMTALPKNLTLNQIQPGEEFLPSKKFDLIYSWSVFEHVEQPLLLSIIKQLKGKLQRNGRLFIQIAPLYYSAEGSHLFHKIPIPWGHLSIQENIYLSKLMSACNSIQEFEVLRSCYQTLNRMTIEELIGVIEDSGLRILRKYTTSEAIEPPKQLLGAYKIDALKINQIVLLATH